MSSFRPGRKNGKKACPILAVVLSIGLLSVCRSEQAPGPGRPAAGPASEAEIISYDRIRVEFSTTSDWARLELLNPQDVLAMRLIAATVDSPGLATNAGLLNLNQSLENARAGRRLSLIADYALALEARKRPLQFYLQKGSINESRVRVSGVGDGGDRLLGQKDHVGFNAADPGFNPLDFLVDMSPLEGSPSLQARVGLGSGKRMRWEFYDPERSGAGAAPEAPSPADEILGRMSQAKSRGIDGFFLYWRGPSRGSDARLSPILEIAAQEKFRVAIYFEVPGASNGSPQNEAPITDALAWAIGRYGDHSAVFKVDGRPLFAVWASEAVPLESWGRIFASLRDRGVSAAALSMGIRQDDFEFYYDRGGDRAFLYPGPQKSGWSFARGPNYYSLLKDAQVPPIWITTVQPSFKRIGREHRLIWDLRF